MQRVRHRDTLRRWANPTALPVAIHPGMKRPWRSGIVARVRASRERGIAAFIAALPVEDEAIPMEEEEEAVERALADIAAGRVHTHAEAMRILGLGR